MNTESFFFLDIQRRNYAESASLSVLRRVDNFTEGEKSGFQEQTRFFYHSKVFEPLFTAIPQ